MEHRSESGSGKTKGSKGRKRSKRKLPTNPTVGKTYTITVNNPRSGTRYVTFRANKKSGKGKWSTISNTKGRGRPKGGGQKLN